MHIDIGSDMERQPSSTEPLTRTAELALQVVADCALLPEITSFLPGVPVWTIEYEHNLGPKTSEVTIHERAKMSMGTSGLLPRLAIHHRDLTTLARLYRLHKQPQFRQKGKFWFTSAMHDAALSGHVDVLQWLHENTDVELRSDTVNMAAREGHADALRWVWANHTKRKEKISTSTVERVAADGRLHVLQLLQGMYAGPVDGALNAAAGNGHLDVVLYLWERRGNVSTAAIADSAAAGGHLHVLEWLLEHHCLPFTQEAAYEVVCRGHAAVASFLWETRDSWTVGGARTSAEIAFKTGARNGISHAIRKGDLAMVELLLEILPDQFPPFALTIAASYGQLKIVKAIHHAGSRSQRDLDEALVTAKRGGHTAIRAYLLDPLAANDATSEEDTVDQPLLDASPSGAIEDLKGQAEQAAAAFEASSAEQQSDLQPRCSADRRILRARRK